MSKFGEAMRGLTVFISDIRNCKSKEAERKRVNKELANIRSKFKGDKIDGYQKKKYVCKLLFIFLLGYDVNFGYQEAVNLLSSIRFSEKQIGYLFVSVVMGDDHDLMPLVIKAIRYDLESRNPIFNTLAMQCIANIANRDMVEQLGKDAVPNLLTSPDTNAAVKQTACLCLLKLIRVDSKIIPIEQHATRIMRFINDKHLGLVTAACSLLEELARIYPEVFQSCVSDVISKLAGIVTKSHSDMQDYTYYFVPAPWLCVKLMKLLQCYPVPNDAIVKARLHEALDAILNRATESGKSKKVQHSNAKNAVMFEAISLIVHQSDNSLQVRACNLLGTYLTHKETNMRYLSLDGLCNLCTSDFSQEAVRKHQEVVINALKTERDISVRQKAIDLLYAMCDHSNAQTIVGELLQYLEKADFSVREPLVLKIAILSEKYAHDYTWYVDTILNLIRLAGDYVSEEVWYRIIQIVINKQEVQGYSAKTSFEALQAPACHENMIKVGGYILGEFGNLIAGDPRSGPIVQFQLLHSKFPFCSLGTRALLLSTYIKFINLYPEIKQHIQDILSQDSQSRNADLELQQRAIEYLKMSHIASHDLMATILEEMPQFPEKDSLLLSKLYKTAPWMAKLHDSSSNADSAAKESKSPVVATTTVVTTTTTGPATSPTTGPATGNLLSVDVAAAPTPSTTTSAPSNSALLGDVYATVTPKSALVDTADTSKQETTLTPGAEEGFKRFYTKNSGVLFENQALQIGIKSEFKKNLGRIGIFYGNKSSSSLSNCTADASAPPESTGSLNIQVKPIPSSIDGGAQVQQIVNIECLDLFYDAPLLTVNFNLSGAPHHLVLKLPAMLYKFSEPAIMDSTQFFARWKQLSNPVQEVQRIYAAKQPFERDSVEAKLKGFGLSVLTGIDPNPENYVSASIINTSKLLVGCLVRLEPNSQTQQYRLTIRTSHEEVSKLLNRLLSEQF